jgi:hypothetical protein
MPTMCRSWRSTTSQGRAERRMRPVTAWGLSRGRGAHGSRALVRGHAAPTRGRAAGSLAVPAVERPRRDHRAAAVPRPAADDDRPALGPTAHDAGHLRARWGAPRRQLGADGAAAARRVAAEPEGRSARDGAPRRRHGGVPRARGRRRRDRPLLVGAAGGVAGARDVSRAQRRPARVRARAGGRLRSPYRRLDQRPGSTRSFARSTSVAAPSVAVSVTAYVAARSRPILICLRPPEP